MLNVRLTRLKATRAQRDGISKPRFAHTAWCQFRRAARVMRQMDLGAMSNFRRPPSGSPRDDRGGLRLNSNVASPPSEMSTISSKPARQAALAQISLPPGAAAPHGFTSFSRTRCGHDACAAEGSRYTGMRRPQSHRHAITEDDSPVREGILQAFSSNFDQYTAAADLHRSVTSKGQGLGTEWGDEAGSDELFRLRRGHGHLLCVRPDRPSIVALLSLRPSSSP